MISAPSEWFSSYEGRIGYDVHDLDIPAGDDVAFCHSLYRVSGTMKNGQQVGMWVRAALCLRKLDGAWKVTHEHNSAPFDGQSGKAALDLKPQDLAPARGEWPVR
jgi:ketosteroid isomerase-like protein